MSNKSIKNKMLWAFIFTTGFVGAICYLYFNNFSGDFSNKQSDWGSFGSYVGGTISALFASLSFLTLLYAIYLQRKELNTAITALNKSADAHEQQVKNNEIQKFESTFYSLLEQHNQALKELTSSNIEYHAYLSNLKTIEENISQADYLKNRQLHILENVELSQYFRVLYQLLKFVAKNNVKNPEKRFDEEYIGCRDSIVTNENEEKLYASIIRSFIPVNVLPVLALNCIPSYKGLNNLQMYWGLFERYEFLEHMRLDKMPVNLTTFLILDRYSHALGSNDFLQEKYGVLLKKYKNLFDTELTEGCYLHVIHSANI